MSLGIISLKLLSHLYLASEWTAIFKSDSKLKVMLKIFADQQ